MSQFDFGTIDPFVINGVTLTSWLNQWRDAIHSLHRGPARPSYAVPGMMWIDDTGGDADWLVKVYASPAIGDVPLWHIDTTTGAITYASAELHTPSPPAAENSDRVPSTAWVQALIAAGASISVGPAPPVAPNPNQLWWNSDASAGGGVLYIYYNDGNTTQWVPVAPTGNSPPTRTYDEYTAIGQFSALIPMNNAVPLATAGTNILSRTITVAAQQKVRASFRGTASLSGAGTLGVILTRSGSANALRAAATGAGAAGYVLPLYLEYQDVPGAGTWTYGINVGPNQAPPMIMNSSVAAGLFGGIAACTLTLEIF
jgi:hypothetical protein